MIFIVLLRGINVSGQKKIKMADLRSMLNDAGFDDVQTYIQSGNIILKSHLKADEITDKIKTLIDQNYGWEVPVLTRSAEEWENTIRSNPFTDREEGRLYVTMLAGSPSTENVEALNESNTGNEEFALVDKDVFLYVPEGYGRAKLNNNFIERKLNVAATTRNWKTMKKLRELAESGV